MQTTDGKWCLGHGVAGQAESLRTGHYVEAHLVPDVFSISNGAARVAKGLGHNLHPRCRLCRSIRRWHDHHANAIRRARRFRRDHAKRWVKAGRRPTIEAALMEMDVGGITDEAVAALIIEAIGEPCPGLCAHEEDRQIVFHTIDRVQDIDIDVRNPGEQFSIENLGVLCVSCNRAKGDTPWPRFVYMRRAVLRAWQAAIDLPGFRRPEQLGFDL